MVNPADESTQLGKVYFQAETNIERIPPYIVYDQDQARNKFADNIPYRHTKRWSIEVIDPNADSDIPDKVAALPMSTFQRRFKTAGLYHTIYSLYF
jgi:hypothetical protein